MRGTMRWLAVASVLCGLLLSAAGYALYSTGFMGLELSIAQQYATARFRGTPLTPFTLIWLGLLGLPIGLRVYLIGEDGKR